jgi:uncharacterized membrane protein YuzA (DUF378 family)
MFKKKQAPPRRDYWLLRGLLSSAGASHMALGIMTLAGKEGINLGAQIYGVSEPLDEQVHYVAGLAGVYLFSMGGLMTLAAIDPRRYRGVIDFSLLLYIVNTYFRLRHYKDAERLFGVTPDRLWARIIFLDTIGGLMLWQRMKLEHEKIDAE